MKSALLVPCVVFLMIVYSGHALAKDSGSKPPEVKIKLSEKAEAIEDSFQKEKKKLKKEQKALLDHMESVFVSTVDPDIEILRLASDIEACDVPEEEKGAMMSQFNEVRNKKNDSQVVMWGKFQQKFYSQVDFMDHELLKSYLAVKLMTAMKVASDMIKIQAHQFDKELQCERARQTLLEEAKKDSEDE